MRGGIAALAMGWGLLLAGPAEAEWFARCEGGQNAACYGEACGGTKEEARAFCLEQCPGGDTHSVGISSCKVQRKTQTPPAKATPTTKGSAPAP